MSQQNLEEDQEEPLKEQGDQDLKIHGFHSPTVWGLRSLVKG